MSSITPVLLAGGTGTRLWPLSRKSYPKQFSNLIGEGTLFQQAAQRLVSSEIIEFNPHITLTNSEYRFIVSEQLSDVGLDPGPILIEPKSMNTAPSILAASVFCYNQDVNSILLVSPSDHVVSNVNAFHQAISLGLKPVENKKIATFGITPSNPETGYGYLELKEQPQSEPVELLRFIEKPNKSQAEKMLKSGKFLWNAGIFLFRAEDMIEAFEIYDPSMLRAVERAVLQSKTDLGFLRLNEDAWLNVKNISIDYAIMEKVDNLVAVPYTKLWSDLGSWTSVGREMASDKFGNTLTENAHAINCDNTTLRSENIDLELVGMGLTDIVVVAMRDAVLVAHKDKDQDVKKIVSKLKRENVKQAEIFPKDHRPWGWFESLAISDSFQVKRIYVNPGAALSLQSHNHRSEHWVVVQGTAKVTIGKKIELVSEGQSVYVPLGAVHRMENPSTLPMILIEVQTGTYFGEDDIIRYEDVYSRD